MSVGIALMSRAPIPGKTKTRLQTHLTPQEAASLHTAFLYDMGQMLLQVSKSKENTTLYLAYTPQGTASMFTKLIPSEFDLFVQKGDNLGERMYYCLKKMSEKHDKQIIVGSDLPTLQPEVLLTAIELLDKKEIVIGPSADGGYYLLGTRQPYSFLFNEIPWGRNEVLNNTINEINKREGLTYGLVDTWWDVDTYSELLKLKESLTTRPDGGFYPEKTAALLERIFDRRDIQRMMEDECYQVNQR